LEKGESIFVPAGDFDALILDDSLTGNYADFSKYIVKRLKVRYPDIIAQGENGGIGLKILGGYGSVFEDIEVYNAPFRAFYVAKGLRSSAAEHVFRHCYPNKCYDGFYAEGAVYDLYVSNLPAENCQRFGVYLEGGNHNVRHVHAVACQKGIELFGHTNTLIDCHADHCYEYGIIVNGNSNVFIGSKAYDTGTDSDTGIGWLVQGERNSFLGCVSRNSYGSTKQSIGLMFTETAFGNIWIGGFLERNQTRAIHFGNSQNNIVALFYEGENAQLVDAVVNNIVSGVLSSAGLKRPAVRITEFQNNWTTDLTVEVYRDVNGKVTLSGAIKSGNANSVAFTLPFKPKKDTRLVTLDYNKNPVVIFISATSWNLVVYPKDTSSGWNNRILLDGLSYETAVYSQ